MYLYLSKKTMENLKLKDAAILLNITRRMLLTPITNGELPHVKLARHIYIDKADLLAWWESKKGGAKKEVKK